jgi:methanogenic corrinoid protein MtbC1
MPTLRDAVANLRQEETLLVIRMMIDRGDAPKEVLAEARQGLQMVGERFEAKQYALIELEMANELYRECVKTVEELTNRKDTVVKKSGKRPHGFSKKTDQGRVD